MYGRAKWTGLTRRPFAAGDDARPGTHSILRLGEALGDRQRVLEPIRERSRDDAAAIHDDKMGNAVVPSSLSQDRQDQPNSRIALTSPPSVRQTAVDAM